MTFHKRSLIMRRRYADLSFLTERIVQINGSKAGYKGDSPPTLRTADGRLIEFGAAQHLGDEQSWQGRPHDFLGLDEATQFLEAQVRFLMGWVRSTEPGQRTRVVLATNPPVDASGDWIVGMFRPWLDVTHPNPAKPGDLRWFVTDPDGKDMEVGGPEPYQFPGVAKTVQPLSRTFIPAKLSDNPFLAKTDYGAKLDALPEPIRSAVRDGNFMAARPDAERQVIPTAWVMAAVGRHTTRPADGEHMTAIAADVAQGGADDTVISSRFGLWFAPLVVVPGAQTETPSKTAALVVQHRRHNAIVVVDKGGGYGGGVIERLREQEPTTNGDYSRNDIGSSIIGFDGAGAPRGVTNDAAKLRFVNRRAEAWWRMREALDPDQLHGSQIALPNDPALIADLTAPTFDMKVSGIVIESKDDIRKRLGRSPDRGDAVVMCLYEGQHQIERGVVALRKFNGSGGRPHVVVGYGANKRYARPR